MLFGHIEDNAFLVFSRKNRELYAEVILLIFREFYSGHKLASPLRGQVLDAIVALLGRRPDLWTDTDEEDGRTLSAICGIYRAPRVPEDKASRYAHHVYGRLVESGWLEEEPFGFNAVVEMPPAAMAMADQFDSIERGLSELFGGFVATVKSSLEAIKDSPADYALGLSKSADNCRQFTRRLRAIYSSLRAVRKALLKDVDVRKRIDTLFEAFIERILVTDYKAVFSYANHPLRFRHDVIQLSTVLAGNRSMVTDIAKVYVENEVVQTQEEAEARVWDELQVIREVFENLHAYVMKIDQFRVTLEKTLRNTIRYLDRADESLTGRIATVIQRLDALQDRMAEKGGELDLPSILTLAPSILGPDSPATPRKMREPIKPLPVVEEEPDPLDLLRDDLSEEFKAMLEPDDDIVAEFLDRVLPVGGPLQGRDFPIHDLPAFACFDRTLTMMDSEHDPLRDRFEVTGVSGRWIDNEWIEAPEFIVRHVKPEGAA